MKSKAEIVREHLMGLCVLDIGGIGYRESNPYELELFRAWSSCKKRVYVDNSDDADISIDLNVFPLPFIGGNYDIAIAFDVLEHLERPVDVLRWIPCSRLIVILPNVMSWFNRQMEETNKSKHLYSFTPYTASVLLAAGGWKVKGIEYQFGKWSLLSRAINAVGSLYPSCVGTGIVFYCARK